MSDLILTNDQQAAYEGFIGFVMDPTVEEMTLEGYAGTGKSTLVNKLLSDLPNILKTARILTQDEEDWEVALTATTNKAAEALSDITNSEVRTIQSFLKLIVARDHKTGETQLEARDDAEVVTKHILFIDECSYIDPHLLELIDAWTEDCKIVYIGDPAQLSPVKFNYAPVFLAGYPRSALTEVVRQAKGNSIIDLATAFRNTVNTGQFFSFEPDGANVIHLPQDKFEQAVVNEFNRPDWHHNDSKVLAWTNRRVIDYNKAIRNVVQGIPELEIGDYAICNAYINNKQCRLKTDQTVMITDIEPFNQFGVDGWTVSMDNKHRAFLPRDNEDKKARLRKAKKADDTKTFRHIEDHWIDLRAAYACTVNKSQGSTYDRVFIDLNDISKCHNGNQIARMLYVAVSRARHQVFLTGDLV